MRRRQGLGLADALVATALIACGLIPLLELVRANAAAVRPREMQVRLMGLAGSCLERVAAGRVWDGPLRERCVEAAPFEGEERERLAHTVLGTVPTPLALALREARVSLTVEKRDRLKAGEAALEAWVMQVRWFERGENRTRTLFRMAARR